MSSDIDLMPWFEKYVAPGATFNYCPLSVGMFDPKYYPNCVAAKGKAAYLAYVQPNLFSEKVHFYDTTMTEWVYLVSEDGKEVHARYNVSGILDGRRLPPAIDQVMAWKFDDSGLIYDTTLLTDTLFWNMFSRMSMGVQLAEAQKPASGGVSDHGLYSPLDDTISWADYVIYYNCLTVGFAGFAAGTIFMATQLQSASQKFRTALVVALLVDFILACQYAAGLASWTQAVAVSGFTVTVTGRPFMFNWLYSDLLGMPLSLVSLVLVMQLPVRETLIKSGALTVATVAMILFAFYGDTSTISLAIGVVFFGYILYELVLGLEETTRKQPANAASLVRFTRWFIALTWSAYPFVAVLPMIGTGTATAMKVAYTVLDLLMKAGSGILIWSITVCKTEVDGALLG